MQKKAKNRAEIIEQLKERMNSFKLTVTHDPLVPEWLAADMLRLKSDVFVEIVLLDDCPLKPIYKSGGRFYRLDDIAEFYETYE
ncbi:hypothetical protein [Methylophaga muralis]|uniref:Uncharacterized protein n=1 Tax=Methylophaga muralis TaxID=291169 RepID=A0A1E3GQ21_9GAMM|nr:hypothetical protein [Methylophaga muralis]ODN66139.1 hypothetical protein A9E74_02158 [Methylophaga muralis]